MTDDELDNSGGHEGPRSDPPDPLPDPGTAVERSYPICGAKKSQGGDECTLKAGWTTDHVGEEKYKLTVASLPISSTVMGCTSRKYRHGVSRRRSLLAAPPGRTVMRYVGMRAAAVHNRGTDVIPNSSQPQATDG